MKQIKNNKKKYNKPGRIKTFFSGVAQIEGLKGVFLHEELLDESDLPVGIVIGFNDGIVEVLFFDEKFDINKPVFRSEKVFSISVSDKYIGRVVDGLSRPIDGFANIAGKTTGVFKESPPIIDREPITIPLSTGIKIIDTTLPLGKGQRQLIIGDQKLGKSTIAIDIVLNQKHASPPMHCVYVVCGQKKQKLNDLISIFSKHNTFLYTTIVAATAGDSFASQYLAPFVGCTIGEYFRDRGEDALVVFDDLSKHAKAYRDISLLFKRPPGREAYPGNIFSLHANLLERAAKLSKKKKGGSLSSFPIIETQEGDISSFIPTNIISITDGQIYIERGLYQKRFLPAVNVGLSVSRIGLQAQQKLLKGVVGGIRLALAQHKELQKLSQLETVVSKEAQKKIYRGKLMLELLKQDKHTNVMWYEQVFLFFIVEQGYFDDIKKGKWSEFERLLLQLARNKYYKLFEKIKSGTFDDNIKEKIHEIVKDFKREFMV